MRPAGVLATAMVAATGAGAQTVSVPGHANPYLAGMPDGAEASRGDKAPAQSPVLVSGPGIAAGFVLEFDVTGAVTHTGAPGGPGPDGAGSIHHYPGAQNGMSGVTAPINALMGVFLGPEVPGSGGAPEDLDFTAMGTDFAALEPEIGQVFFIGDGRGAGDAVQTFQVPKEATRLYLGTMDGFGWYNNAGSFEVTVRSRDLLAP